MTWREVHFQIGFLKMTKAGNDKTIDHKGF